MLGDSYIYLFGVLIGSLVCLCPLLLATVPILVLVLQHSVENGLSVVLIFRKYASSTKQYEG